MIKDSHFKKVIHTSLIVMVSILLAACDSVEGGSDFIGRGDSDDSTTGTLSIGIADGPVDDALEVVLKVDKITLKKAGSDDVVIDQFTSTDLGVTDAETVAVDLLLFQGGDQAMLVTEFEVAAGTYSNLILTILDDDINNSYVLDVDGNSRVLNMFDRTMELGSFTVEKDLLNTLTLDFNLQMALVYDAASNEYTLTSTGIRLQNNNTDRTISGEVDSSLFDTVSPCDEKINPTAGNRVYLYQGHDLDESNLADIFDSAKSTDAVPDEAIAPYAVAAVVDAGGEWEYNLAFLPAGEYTLVFSCAAEDDDPENYDGLVLPLPVEQLIEISVESGSFGCDLPIVDESCS
ncbi:MAG: DUF4382 domain-containing protein [Spongiibacteraceae bacterium]